MILVFNDGAYGVSLNPICSAGIVLWIDFSAGVALTPGTIKTTVALADGQESTVLPSGQIRASDGQ